MNTTPAFVHHSANQLRDTEGRFLPLGLDRRFQFRLSARELAIMKAVSAEQNETVSSFIRRSALETAQSLVRSMNV